MKTTFFVLVALLGSFSFCEAATLSQQVTSYHQQAEEALKRGDSSQAITYYQKITALSNNDTLAHNILGLLYEGNGQLERSEAEYLSALSLAPKYLDARYNLTRLYERIGQREKAVEHLEKFITLAHPKDKRVAEAKNKIINLTVPAQRTSDLIKNIEKEQAAKLAQETIKEKRLAKKENKEKSKHR